MNDAPDVDLDLSSCAREPIHTPGAIQPYGVLLVVDPLSMRVQERAVSQAQVLEDFGDPLDQHLDRVLGGALVPYRRHLDLLAPESTVFLGSVQLGRSGRHHALAHRSETHFIIELEEPVEGEPGSLEDLYPHIRRFMGEVEVAPDIASLCEIGARHVRDLAGFDRTLIYQFDKDWNGAVVAEDRNDRLPSYMDLRFPESDIPAQARELYRRNRVRLIADNDYRAVPLLRSAGLAGAPPHRPQPGGPAQRFARAPAVHAQHGNRRLAVGVAAGRRPSVGTGVLPQPVAAPRALSRAHRV